MQGTQSTVLGGCAHIYCIVPYSSETDILNARLADLQTRGKRL